MFRTPRRRKVTRIGLHSTSHAKRNGLYKPSLETEDDVVISNFDSDDDDIPSFLTPDRTGSAKRSKPKHGRSNQFHHDDSFLIESCSPLKTYQDDRDRIESFASPKRSQRRNCGSLITSFPSPAKSPSSPSLPLYRFNRPSCGSMRKRRSKDPKIDSEDPSIIESYEDSPAVQFCLEETECPISTNFSPVKIDLITAAFKKDQSSFTTNRGRPRPVRRKIDTNDPSGPSTAATPSTQSSLVFKSDFLKSLYKQIRKDTQQLEYERLKFNRLSDEEKNQQKSIHMQILAMVTDANLSVIEGEVVDLVGFDGTDNDETDLMLKKIRIILPKDWSEGMGLTRFTVLQLFYPLNLCRTVDDRLLLDNIFWIQVEKRGNPKQATRDPLEKLIHQWDCLCQVSGDRALPACSPRECELKNFAAQNMK